MAEITVRLLAGDNEERSFSLSREFSSDVARLSGVVSHAPPAAAPEPGKKGDPITLGAIVIAAASGGALTALVNTIGSYLTHDKRTEVEISRPDGLKIKISSAKTNFAELEAALRRILLAMTGD
jgi:Effector Associated Constant Component 1